MTTATSISRRGRGAAVVLAVAIIMVVAASSSALPLPDLEETLTNTQYNDTSRSTTTPEQKVDDLHALSCPDLHGMVASAVGAARSNPNGGSQITAGLLRIFFHDCFPQGCDASILLDGAERDMIHNQGLQKQALDLIERIRDTVHKRCGANSVSCADILALATAHAVGQAGGPWINIPLGRRDSEGPAAGWEVERLPRPDASVDTLLTSFGKRGLDGTDLVALSGAHTVGKATCGSFRDRIDKRSSNDNFASRLAGFCGQDDNLQHNLDVRTPDTFDNRYFEDLVRREGVLTTDQGLLFDGRTSWLVHGFARDQNWFFGQFARSMEKMSRMGLGKGAEIRNNCSKRNPKKIAQHDHDAAAEGLAASA